MVTKAIQKTEGGNGKRIALTTADLGILHFRVKDNEIMRLIKSDMTLYEKMGHFFKMKDDYPISYEGFKHLNKVASINIVTPQKVMIDERERLNPHVERNPKTKMIETVTIRKIGIGYSPAGNITVIDKTLFYNLYSYFIESVQAKMKRVKWDKGKPTNEKQYPDCAEVGTEDKKPSKEGSWVFFETMSPLGIWINYEDSAIQDCLNEHTQRQRFGDRIAQTIVERNILKDHPAIGISKVQAKDGQRGLTATVPVYGYRHEYGIPQINEILAQAEKGEEAIEVKAEVIEEVEYEEEAEVMKEVVEDEGPKKKKGKTPAEMDEPPDDFQLSREREPGEDDEPS